MDTDKDFLHMHEAHNQAESSPTSPTAAPSIVIFPEEANKEEHLPKTFEKKAQLINVHWKVRSNATPVAFPLQDKVTSDSSQPCDMLNTLRGPEHDVQSMRQLLIDVYKYAPDDIVILIDDDNLEQKQPTWENMFDEIKKLRKDVEDQDHFSFHIGDSSKQEVSHDITEEEDGKDEFILTSGERISDEDLRARLTETLPVGSTLTAVFDTCHSGSLLDLGHHKCNRVHLPLTNKGARKTNTIWNANRRKQAPASFSQHSPSVLADSQGAVINGGTFIATNSMHVESAGNLLPYTLLAFQTTLGAIHIHSSCPGIETPPPFDLMVSYRTSLPIYYEDLPIVFSPLVFLYLWRLIFGHHSLNLNTG